MERKGRSKTDETDNPGWAEMRIKTDLCCWMEFFGSESDLDGSLPKTVNNLGWFLVIRLFSWRICRGDTGRELWCWRVGASPKAGLRFLEFTAESRIWSLSKGKMTTKLSSGPASGNSEHHTPSRAREIFNKIAAASPRILRRHVVTSPLVTSPVVMRRGRSNSTPSFVTYLDSNRWARMKPQGSVSLFSLIKCTMAELGAVPVPMEPFRR